MKKTIILSVGILLLICLSVSILNLSNKKPSSSSSSSSISQIISSSNNSSSSSVNTSSSNSSSSSISSISSSNSSSSVSSSSSTNSSISSSGSSSSSSSQETKPLPKYETVKFKESKYMIGQYSSILGTTKRKLPSFSNEGATRYPTYGTSISSITDEEKKQLISESNYLKSSSSTYDEMDEFGNLYLNGEKLDRKLYAHTTSLDTYFGSPSNEENAIIKEINYKPRIIGNHLTGLYAPAGEVIKIEMSKEDLESTGGVNIEIGQFSQNNQLNNIWEARNDFSRMPLLGNEMSVSKEISYVGSFIGGPIYVTPNKKVPFKIKISGALEYCHFIYGQTTKEEFDRLKKTSAPYFDLEIFDNCVRHSTPRKYAEENLDFNNLCKISELWMSISNISKQVPSGSNKNIGITFIYDTFIAAGGAVAFVGRNWCNLPSSWATNSLNFEKFTTQGDWGTIHEFNHHYQRYGFNPGDEVTNNALNLLSYISYTNISENRVENGWNRYLDPIVSLKETLNLSKEGNPIASLNSYADIIHTFGVDTFIKACKFKQGSGGVDNWYESLCEATNYDMSYYFSLLNQEVSSSLKEKYKHLPKYIPIAYKYQTGRVIDNKDIITVKPYKFDIGSPFVSSLEEDIILPSSCSFEIESISSPKNGTLKVDGNKISYTPNGKLSSGEIKLKLNVKNETNEIITQTIIFELMPSYKGIDATLYKYSSSLYSSIKDAQENNFAGYDSITSSPINKHFVNGIKSKEIMVYKGKIYMPKDGNYKISTRTSFRSNTLLELGLTNNYSEEIYSPSSSPIDHNETYKTFNVKKGDYIYFRVSIQNINTNDAFAELLGGYENENLASINTSYLYNENDEKSPIIDNFDFYPRPYNIDSLVSSPAQKVVSYTESYSRWDDNATYDISNIVDGNEDSAYHSIRDKYISSEPFEVTIDLGDEYLVNTLNIIGYKGNQAHDPTSFILYGGTSLDDLKEIKVVETNQYTNRKLQIKFDDETIRYYKIKVTKTSSNRYVAFNEINLSYDLKGKLIEPAKATYQIKDGQYFEKENNVNYFGYSINGEGKISLQIEGTSFGMLTLNKKTMIKLTIDGEEKVQEINGLFYINIGEGSHSVIIETLDSPINILSFIKDI